MSKSFSWILMLLLVEFIIIGCSEGSKEEVDPIIPEITFDPVVVTESDDSPVTATVTLTLSEPAPDSITLVFNTVPVSAGPDDFLVVTNGIILIPKGDSEAQINIEIRGDEFYELTETFILEIDDNASLSFQNREVQISIKDNDELIPEISEDSDGFLTPITYEGMNLVWSDEFDGEIFDTDSWTYAIGDGCPDLCGWGNNELQTYTDNPLNVFMENGRLVIRAMKNDSPPVYTSGRILTEGKQEFKFGRIDIRAKLPEGQGIWPALWMLGTNLPQVGWPVCGEIDIMELVGHEPSTVHGTIHFDANGYESRSGDTNLNQGKFSDKFHVFTILWDVDRISWLVDYDQFYTIQKSSIGNTYPFNNDFYFLINLAVGGNWPGPPDQTTTFPQRLEVDYIRVFQ